MNVLASRIDTPKNNIGDFGLKRRGDAIDHSVLIAVESQWQAVRIQIEYFGRNCENMIIAMIETPGHASP